jgi:hypothetical protein
MRLDDKESEFVAAIKKHLALRECRLEDGALATNLDGICQMLVAKALDGDLVAVDFIAKLMK